MDRFPIIITVGGMLLGWIAGTMAVSDPALAGWLTVTRVVHYSAGVAGMLVVLVLGILLNRRQRARPEASGEAGAP